MKKLILTCFILSYSLSLYSQDKSFGGQNYSSHTLNNNILLITCDNSIVEVSPVTETIVRVACHNDFKVYQDSSIVVVLPLKNNIPVKLLEFSNKLEYSTDSVLIVIQKKPLKFSYYYQNKNLLNDSIGFYRYEPYDYRGIFLKLDSSEFIYGTGPRADSYLRNKTSNHMYNVNRFGYKFGYNGSLNISVPFVISSKNYGIYFDNPGINYLNIDFNDINMIEYVAWKNKFSYYFIAGYSFSDIHFKYTGLTGRQPLPPRWLFGYLQSRAFYNDEKHLDDVVKEMINQDFPLDGIIYDMNWFGKSTNMGNFVFDTVTFPNYLSTTKRYNSMGIKSMILIHPHISNLSININDLIKQNHYVRDSLGNVVWCAIQATTSAIVDFTHKDAGLWYWQKSKPRLDDGLYTFWCDNAEPDCHPPESMHSNGKPMILEHNIYSNRWLEALYTNGIRDFPDKRMFCFIRSGWAGIQRFGAVPLCGDESRSWDGFKAMIPTMLGASISGIGYYHSDAGGFAPVDDIKNEVRYTRWMQFGVFSPVFRVHTAGPVEAEPIFYSDTVKKIVRYYSKLRNRLLPYNYTLAYENSMFGKPLVKPINFYEPSDQLISNIIDEYLWGDNILVAPVVDSVYSRNVVFPSGLWIDFVDGTKYQGLKSYQIDAPLNKLPLFIKAGSVIPMGTEINNISNYTGDTLYFQYYPSIEYPKTDYNMFEDDGKSQNTLENLNFFLINFTSNVESKKITINLSQSGKGYANAPDSRTIVIKTLYLDFKPGSVKINNNLIEIKTNYNDFHSLNNSCYFNKITNELLIKFKWDLTPRSIHILEDDTGAGDNNNKDISFIINSISPLPFINQLFVEMLIESPVNLTFSVYNLSGNQVYQSFHTFNFYGLNKIIWDGKTNQGIKLPGGAYYIKISDNQNLKYFTKIVIKL